MIQHVKRFGKLVPSLLPNVDLSTRKIQVFIRNTKSMKISAPSNKLINTIVLLPQNPSTC